MSFISQNARRAHALRQAQQPPSGANISSMSFIKQKAPKGIHPSAKSPAVIATLEFAFPII